MQIYRALLFLAFILISNSSLAQTPPGTVYTVPCIKNDSTDSCSGYLNTTDFNNANLANTVVMALGYHAPGDGGGGWFYSTGQAGTGNQCPMDYGTLFGDGHSANPDCFARRFTGTVYMQWFGVKNSINIGEHDVAAACGGTTTPCWTYAFTAAANAASAKSGNNTVSTGGVYLFSTAEVNPGAGQTLTCDAPLTQEEQGSDYTRHSNGSGVVGAIVLQHPAKIHFTNRANEFHHCVVLTIGDPTPGQPLIKLNPANQRDALNNNKNMVANGDVGVFCDGPDATYIHDVTVIGFDTGRAGFGNLDSGLSGFSA